MTSNSTNDASLGPRVNDDSGKPDLLTRYGELKPTLTELSTKPFFARRSTRTFSDALASMDPVTIYAGAGVSADIGAPLSPGLMAFLLEELLRRSNDYKDDLADSTRQRRVVRAIREAYPAPSLGSIARHLAHTTAAKDHGLKDAIIDANASGLEPGGFLARSVGKLAFTLHRKGVRVQVITTNYDDALSQHEPEFVRRSVEDYVPVGDRQATDTEVPIFHVNGAVHDSEVREEPVLSEMDFFSGNHAVRESILADALRSTDCLFVGSSLNDPDLLQTLANQPPGHHQRFAIMIAPDREESTESFEAVNPVPVLRTPDGDGLSDPDDRYLARDLVARRFLHVGIVPIMVEFPHQIPQLLNEVAIRLDKQFDPNYADYSERLERWWLAWGERFGYSNGRDPGIRNRNLQKHWLAHLANFSKALRQEFDLPTTARSETLMVEVWIRNPLTRELFLWATSEGLWRDGRSAHECGLDTSEASRFGAQVRTFCTGCVQKGPVDPQRGKWRYHVSVPLVLYEEPWSRLPVGVANILSNADNGELYRVSRHFSKITALIDDLKAVVNPLLDPEQTDPNSFEWSRSDAEG